MEQPQLGGASEPIKKLFDALVQLLGEEDWRRVTCYSDGVQDCLESLSDELVKLE